MSRHKMRLPSTKVLRIVPSSAESCLRGRQHDVPVHSSDASAWTPVVIVVLTKILRCIPSRGFPRPCHLPIMQERSVQEVGPMMVRKFSLRRIALCFSYSSRSRHPQAFKVHEVQVIVLDLRHCVANLPLCGPRLFWQGEA